MSAVTILKNGGVVIFPTDTVWGIGASAASPKGIAKLYQVKHRPEDKPTAILVADLHQAKQYGIFDAVASKLALHFWPGALTLIVPALPGAPKEVQGKNHTIGLRVPAHSLVQSLCQELGSGIIAGSANFSGEVTPKKYAEISKNLLDSVDMVVSGEEALGQQASTIIDLSTGETTIVRQGPITLPQVKKVLG